MPTEINRRQLRDLVSAGAQLVEVLPEEEYGQQHLPGAVNIPLKELTGESVAALDRALPVIVYCWDSQ